MTAQTLLRKVLPSVPYGKSGCASPILCPKCNSDNLRKDGKHRMKRGFIQRYFCKSCGLHFVYPRLPARPKASTKPRKKRLKKIRQEITLNHAIKVNYVNQTVDSLVGVPCFLCSELTRGCNPNKCSRLERWSYE